MMIKKTAFSDQLLKRERKRRETNSKIIGLKNICFIITICQASRETFVILNRTTKRITGDIILLKG